MAIATTKFVRKPFYVEAVQVTEQNFMELAFWCQGSIKMKDDSEPERGAAIAPLEQYILVDVLNPKIPRQGQAHVGDWILRTDAGYKVYTDRAFENAFIKAEGEIADAAVQAGKHQPEPIELVEATPQAIADVVNEQQPEDEDRLIPEAEPGADLADAPPPGGDIYPTDASPDAAQADTPTQ